MMISPDAFYISSKFWFSGSLGRVVCVCVCRGEGGQKEQKMAQNDKKFCLTPYLRNCTSYDCGFWYACVKWWYLQQFFSCFQKSDFSGFSKFINKSKKEILKCVPTFLTCVWFLYRGGVFNQNDLYLCLVIGRKYCACRITKRFLCHEKAQPNRSRHKWRTWLN